MPKKLLTLIIIGLIACTSILLFQKLSVTANYDVVDLFREVSPLKSGIEYRGRTYGGAWGDFNNDGYPDLWVNNHLQFPDDNSILYLNGGKGTFTDVTDKILGKTVAKDRHGTAWADVNNDGYQDLVQVVGARRGFGIGQQYANELYINDGEKLEDQASSLGIDYPLARGRSPLWLDFDRDGLLDLFVGAFPRNDKLEAPSKIFKQNIDGTFEDASKITGFKVPDAQFSLLSDLSGDANLDLVVGTFLLRVYDTTSLPFVDITSETLTDFIDGGEVVSADFDGDLLPDLYIAQNDEILENDFYQPETDSAVVRLQAEKSEKGISIDTRGELMLKIVTIGGRFSIPLDEIYIGATGIHPLDFNFTLSPNDPQVEGMFSHIPGVDRGIFIGYNPQLKHWQFLLSSSDRNIFEQNVSDRSVVLAFIQSSEPISNLTAIGFQFDVLSSNNQLLINTPEGFIDQSIEAGINNLRTQGRSAVVGDFDNDMDQDIYVVTSRFVKNTPNILYENQGNGTFIAVPKARGAAGTKIGQGDFVMVADYDMDGFLDLLVGNGAGPLTPLTKDATYQLFHNQGNKNHWLEIDLEGVVSNRDGIGSQVFLTAGGVTQLREQAGGLNHKVQNHQRIHFGLADHTNVDELVINWPSGTKQRLENLSADQLIRVVEEDNDQ